MLYIHNLAIVIAALLGGFVVTLLFVCGFVTDSVKQAPAAMILSFIGAIFAACMAAAFLTM
jgi:hypothetical protein